MTQTLRAVYENGVFRPLEPVHLAQHEEVEVTVRTASAVDNHGARPVSAFFGSISDDDAREMREAIEEAFEQVDTNEWK